MAGFAQLGTRFDLAIRRGADVEIPVVLTNPDGTALNLTGATLGANIRSRAGVVATFAVVVTDAAAGKAKLTLTAAQTRALEAPWPLERPGSGLYQWGLEVELAGKATPHLYGVVAVGNEAFAP